MCSGSHDQLLSIGREQSLRLSEPAWDFEHNIFLTAGHAPDAYIAVFQCRDDFLAVGAESQAFGVTGQFDLAHLSPGRAIPPAYGVVPGAGDRQLAVGAEH